jgi:hypothetical protein
LRIAKSEYCRYFEVRRFTVRKLFFSVLWEIIDLAQIWLKEHLAAKEQDAVERKVPS